MTERYIYWPIRNLGTAATRLAGDGSRTGPDKLRLTTFTDYSLRVLIFLATEPGRRGTIREIAQAFDISENHLMKVAHLLGKAGLLANTRGKGGGLELAKAPRTIKIGRVVRATEGPPLPAECFDREKGHCVITQVCALRGALREAVKNFYSVLDRYTLEDLVHNRQALGELLLPKVVAAPQSLRRKTLPQKPPN